MHKAVAEGEDGLHRIQLAGPDVAEHHAEGGEDQRARRPARVVITGLGSRGR